MREYGSALSGEGHTVHKVGKGLTVYIANKKVTRRLQVIGLIWFVIGMTPPLLSGMVYTEIPINPSLDWQFWIHRVTVDPLTKGIGLIPAIVLIIALITRLLVTANED